MHTVPQNFLRIEPRYSGYARARFAVLPVPYDATTTFQGGTRNAPAAILTASEHFELFDEETQTEAFRAGVATLEPVEPHQGGPGAMHEALFRHTRRIIRDGKFLLALGGEHSISSALVRAVMTRQRKLSVLQIDAHGDLRDTWQGSPYSHACVMRRILDLGAAIVPVGIRSLSLEEHRFVRRQRIPVVTARDCHTDDTWIDRVLNALGETVYVTIDIDGFDPSCAPGTGTPEPGGLDWYQVIGLLRLVAAEKRLVGADIVEVMPIPGSAVTELLAARLAYKLITYVSAGE
ncbi:MAG TPA: agmatinase [Phycisphaerae bacterium]|nr:agmatinase [Phycisphaerae bacterium]HNU46487.1 agmatinase [Phycisphaerae bacterium]